MSLTVHGIPVIDIDSHYTEPPDLWTSRAPAKYKDCRPAHHPQRRGSAALDRA